jgi:hypothetical protein
MQLAKEFSEKVGFKFSEEFSEKVQAYLEFITESDVGDDNFLNTVDDLVKWVSQVERSSQLQAIELMLNSWRHIN